MANLGTVRADIANTLEQDYHKHISKHVKTFDPVLNDILSAAKRKRVSIGGENNNVTWARDLVHGVSRKILGEGEGFGRGSPDVVGRYTLTPVRRAWTVEWTGINDEMSASTTMIDRAYGMQVAARKLKHLAEEVAKDKVRDMAHDGTAVWGQVTAVNTAGDDYFEVDNAVPFEFFEKGQVVNGYDSASGGTPQLTTGGVDSDHSQTILQVDPENRRVYVASVAGLAVGDYIALASMYGQTMPNGLMNIIAATGTIQNVNRATIGNEDVIPWVFTNSGDPLTSDFIDKIRDRAMIAQQQRGRSWKGRWYLSPLTRRLAAQSCLGMNRFTDMEKFRMGTAKVEVATEGGWASFNESAYIRDYQILAFDASSLFVASPEGKENGYAAEVAGDKIMRRTEDGEWLDSLTSTWIDSYNVGVEDNFLGFARGHSFV